MTESKIFIDGERPTVVSDRTFPMFWKSRCPCGEHFGLHDSWREAFNILVKHVREAHL